MKLEYDKKYPNAFFVAVDLSPPPNRRMLMEAEPFPIEVLKGFVSAGEWEPMRDILAVLADRRLYAESLDALIKVQEPSAAFKLGVQTWWTTHGAFIRKAITDDDFLFDALRLMLPRYSGTSRILYRGENIERAKRKCYGAAWTTIREVALTFARGLNAMGPGGGILLQTDAPASAIIAAPCPHSIYLGEYEYIVDRRKLQTVTQLERFPEIR